MPCFPTAAVSMSERAQVRDWAGARPLSGAAGGFDAGCRDPIVGLDGQGWREGRDAVVTAPIHNVLVSPHAAFAQMPAEKQPALTATSPSADAVQARGNGRKPLAVARPSQVPVTQPDDAVERDADRMADLITPRLGRPREFGRSPFAHAPGSVRDAVASPSRSLTAHEIPGTLGIDPSTVRVHEGAKAAESARTLAATAYTVGDHIILGDGYNAHSLDGRRLIAHELAHVAQQQSYHGPPIVYRQGAHVTAHMVQVEDASPGLTLPSAENKPGASQMVTVDDHDKLQTHSWSLWDVHRSAAYVDNNLRSVNPRGDVWTLQVSDLTFGYADGRTLSVPWTSIDFGSQPTAVAYERVGGIIFPLSRSGTRTYDAQNTPKIVQAAQMIRELVRKASADRLKLAQLTFIFQTAVAMNLAALPGILAEPEIPSGLSGLRSVRPSATLEGTPILPGASSTTSESVAGGALRTADDEFNEFMQMLKEEGEGEFKAAGEPVTMQPHGGASEARATLGVTGEHQSMHGLPRSVGKHMPGYDPEAALTTLGERESHTVMDQPWKNAFQNMRRQGRTTASAQEIYDEVAGSIRQSPDLSGEMKNTLTLRLHDEMFVEYGLAPGQQMRLPYPNIKPR